MFSARVKQVETMFGNILVQLESDDYDVKPINQSLKECYNMSCVVCRLTSGLHADEIKAEYDQQVIQISNVAQKAVENTIIRQHSDQTKLLIDNAKLEQQNTFQKQREEDVKKIQMLTDKIEYFKSMYEAINAKHCAETCMLKQKIQMMSNSQTINNSYHIETDIKSTICCLLSSTGARVTDIPTHKSALMIETGSLRICVGYKIQQKDIQRGIINKFTASVLTNEEYMCGIFIAVQSGFARSTGLYNFSIEKINGKPVIFLQTPKDIQSTLQVLHFLVKQQNNDKYIKAINTQVKQILKMKQLIIDMTLVAEDMSISLADIV